ncbi:MAG TPA: AMP-binding protein [Bacteroidales bacterium]|nr:AMP-binding protein [Bacteroidales bacterium]
MIKFIETLEKDALVGKNLSLTYSQLLNQIEHFSSVLPPVKGERVIIFSENRPEYIFALYAIWKREGIAVPVDVMSTQHDVSYIISDATPSVIFCSREKEELIRQSMKDAGENPAVLVFEALPALNQPTEKIGDYTISEADRTALILYTSGTTGNPKGVMLSFKNLLANLTAVCHDVPIFTATDRVMVLLPLHHVLPLVGSIIAPLYTGGTMVLNSSLVAEDLLATLKQFKVTIMIGVPRLYQLIYKGLREKINSSAVAGLLVKMAGAINSLAFSRILFGSVQRKFGGEMRYLVCGGAPIDGHIVKLFKTLGFEILEGFGMTETAPMITFTRPGNIVPGVPGQLLPGLKIRFEEDEIVVSGDNVMQGYYKKPEETSAVLKDGWLYTGDLGFLDKDGNLHITGRKKEIIVLPNGKNINPDEIERAILKQSAYVKEAGVFMKDGVLQAIMVPDFRKLNEAGISNIEEYFRWDIIDKVNRTVSPYKKVLKIHIASYELPKTRIGKLKRFMLPEMAVQKEHVTADEPKTREYQAIKKFLEDETQQDVHPGDHIELDLALDSLGRVSLSAFIETAFGVDVPEQTLADFASVEKLADYLHQKKTRLNFEGISWSQILKEKVHLKLPNSWFTHNMFRNISQVLFHLFMRVNAKGMENLPDEPCIIAPNHQSILDGFLVVSFIKRKFMKKTYVYAKEKHFRHPVLRFLANRNNIILVDVNKDLKLSIQKLAQVLKNRKNLIIFPEGTRTLTGHLGEFKQTFAILARELKVPVVPVAIKGSYNILPTGSRFPKLFRKVSVEFLKPVYPGDHSYESLKNLVYNRLENKLAEKV